MVHFWLTGNTVCRKTNVNQSWKLARDILVVEASFPTSQKAYFTHHTNVRFGSIADQSNYCNIASPARELTVRSVAGNI